MKPNTPLLHLTRLLDLVLERVRSLHYSLKTEKACLNWVQFFVSWIELQVGLK